MNHIMARSTGRVVLAAFASLLVQGQARAQGLGRIQTFGDLVYSDWFARRNPKAAELAPLLQALGRPTSTSGSQAQTNQYFGVVPDSAWDKSTRSEALAAESELHQAELERINKRNPWWNPFRYFSGTDEIKREEARHGHANNLINGDVKKWPDVPPDPGPGPARPRQVDLTTRPVADAPEATASPAGEIISAGLPARPVEVPEPATVATVSASGGGTGPDDSGDNRAGEPQVPAARSAETTPPEQEPADLIASMPGNAGDAETGE